MSLLDFTSRMKNTRANACSVRVIGAIDLEEYELKTIKRTTPKVLDTGRLLAIARVAARKVDDHVKAKLDGGVSEYAEVDMDFQLFQVLRLFRRIKVPRFFFLRRAERAVLLQISDLWNSLNSKFDHYWWEHINPRVQYDPVPEGEIIPIHPLLCEEKDNWPPLTFFPGYSGFETAPVVDSFYFWCSKVE